MAKSASAIQADIKKDIKSGREVGKDLLGPEGLGRLGEDEDIRGILDRFRSIADEGLSSKEVEAERTQLFSGIDRNVQTSLRGLQARLGQSGVKGATAGRQITSAALQGAAQKSEVERKLFIQSAQVKREGLRDLSERTGAVKTFDLGQRAREKDIELQTGLGFAQLGASERSAQLSAQLAAQAAAAGQGGGGGGGLGTFAPTPSNIVRQGKKLVKTITGGTVVCTELYNREVISEGTWAMNKAYGAHLYLNDVFTYYGYLTWGVPVVKLMQTNKLANKILTPVMKHWVDHLGGEETFTNKLVFKVGISLSKIIGKAIKFIYRKNVIEDTKQVA